MNKPSIKGAISTMVRRGVYGDYALYVDSKLVGIVSPTFIAGQRWAYNMSNIKGYATTLQTAMDALVKAYEAQQEAQP